MRAAYKATYTTADGEQTMYFQHRHLVTETLRVTYNRYPNLTVVDLGSKIKAVGSDNMVLLIVYVSYIVIHEHEDHF